MRETLVADLRQRIQDGTYEIDDAAIAERLLAEGEA